MSAKVNTTIAIETTTCASCGVVFGMPDYLMAKRRDDGAGFYCPNGHVLTFGETDADRLRKQLASARRDAEFARTSRDSWRDQAEASDRSRRALRGVITRERKRAAAGVCPVDGCKRTFADLGAHMGTVHPDYETDGAAIDTAAEPAT